MSKTPIDVPGGFVPAVAITLGEIDGEPQPITAATPMPVQTVHRASRSQPLSGETASSGTLGPFNPEIGREIVLTLGGDWQGEVRLHRSIDGGATTAPATLGGEELCWWRSLNEVVWVETEANVSLYLVATLSAGTLAYRFAQ